MYSRILELSDESCSERPTVQTRRIRKMPPVAARQGHRRGQGQAFPGRAVEALFRALTSHAPDVLAELRANSQDEAAIRRWTISHGLHGPAVMEFATGLVSWWARHPHAKSELRTSWRISGVGSNDPYSPEERRYRERLRWPDVGCETARAWRDRATEIYKTLRRFRPPTRQRNGLERETLNRYATWFVQTRVLRISVRALFERGRGSMSMIHKGVSEFARWAEIQK